MIRRIAQRIRHLPALEGAEGLWRILRAPYHRLLNLGGRGVKVMIGGSSPVWMPAQYAGGNWESYEPEAIAVYCQWVRDHPDGMVLDVGSSIGIYTAVALFANLSVEVVAFDADIASLAATRSMCRHAVGNRLRLVYGFLSERSTELASLDSAVDSTEAAIVRGSFRRDTGATRYASLNDPDAGSRPCRRLDDLFPSSCDEPRPVLIKCDVEGAELLVLSGAEKMIRRARPHLLLSVHPPALPSYGHSKEALSEFLGRLGYKIRCIAVDHEEHWWCEPGRPVSSSVQAEALIEPGER